MPSAIRGMFNGATSPTTKRFKRAFKDLRVGARSSTDLADAPLIREWCYLRSMGQAFTLFDYLINTYVDETTSVGRMAPPAQWLRTRLGDRADVSPKESRPVQAADIDHLVGRLASGNRNQVLDACYALLEIGEPAVPAVIREAPTVGNPAVRLLAEFGTPAVDPVLRALMDGEDCLVDCLIWLAEWKANGAWDRLVQVATSHPSPVIRTYAGEALGRIAGERVDDWRRSD